MAEKQQIDIQINVNDSQATQSLDKVKKSTDNVTDSTKDLNKEQTQSLDNMGAFGVTLGGVKSAFAKVIPTAKALFGSIKAGLISTGIGAFVVLIGSLISYFTSTQRGADKLEIALKSVGTAVDVIKDRISSFGEAVTKFFTGDFKGAAETVKDVVSGIGEEIQNEVSAIQEITKSVQELRDTEREFSIERAKTNQEISKARLLAEDENLTLEQRIKHLEVANKLELETTADAIKIAEEKLRLKQEEVALGESLNEDYDELAQLEVELINLQTNSFNTQKRLATGMETLKTELATRDKQREAERQKAIDDENKAKQKLADDDKKRQEEETKKEQEEEQKRKQLRDQRLADKQALTQAEMQLEQQVFTTIQEGVGIIKGALKESSKAQRAVALVELGLNTAKAISTLVSGSEVAAAQFAAATGPAAPFTYAATKIALYTTGLAQIMGNIQQAKDILSSTPQFASGGLVSGPGSGTSDSINANISNGESIINANSTSMFKPLLSAINVAGGGVSFARGGVAGASENNLVQNVGRFMQPQKAFVVTDEMTNSQNQLANIRRKATF
jgi:DNA repair exonuclease SbcCD ATPase subunit